MFWYRKRVCLFIASNKSHKDGFQLQFLAQKADEYSQLSNVINETVIIRFIRKHRSRIVRFNRSITTDLSQFIDSILA